MSGLPFTARALFDYEAVESTELSLTLGCVVIIEEVNESGWSLARSPVDDSVGWIPTEYIEKVDSDGHVISGAEAEISIERPQPSPLSSSVAVQIEMIPIIETTLSQLTLDTPASHSASNTQQTIHKLQTEEEQEQEQEQEEEEAVLRVRQDTQCAAAAATVLPPPAVSASACASGSASAFAFKPPSTNVPPPLSSSSSSPPSSVKVCAHCHDPIRSAFVMAKDLLFHPNHFLCVTCHKPLGGKAYLEKEGQFYCEDDYYLQFNPKCGQCNQVIKGPYVSALNRCYHPNHFVCTACQQTFTNNQFRQHNNLPYCEQHYTELFAPHCHACHLPITTAVFEALDHKYHLECFVCAEDGLPIGEGVMFHIHDGQIYCPTHFESKFLHRCVSCHECIRGQYIKVGDDYYHGECWRCTACQQVLKPESCAQSDGQFYCKTCVKAKMDKPTSQYSSPQTTSTPQQQPIQPKQQIQVPAIQTENEQMEAETETDIEDHHMQHTTTSVDTPIQAASLAALSSSSPTSPFSSAAVSPLPADVSVLSLSSPAALAVVSYLDPTTCSPFPYTVLKDVNARPKTVDPKRKEQYLSDDEFNAVFGMSKDKFQSVAEWKRNEHKKKVGLF